MNNQRRAVYSERRRVLDGRALKKQVIGYGERTMGDRCHVNPDLPPEEWISINCGQGEGVHLSVEDLTTAQIQGLGMEELKAFSRSNCATLTTSRKARSNNSVLA